MNGDFTFHWSMVLYPLAALCYFEVMRRLDEYWARRNPLTDEEILWHHARAEGISELEVFRRAAVSWSISQTRAEEDFNRYLRQDLLPHYLRDYVRKRRPPLNDA
jgi:hypothetical protein